MQAPDNLMLFLVLSSSSEQCFILNHSAHTQVVFLRWKNVPPVCRVQQTPCEQGECLCFVFLQRLCFNCQRRHYWIICRPRCGVGEVTEWILIRRTPPEQSRTEQSRAVQSRVEQGKAVQYSSKVQIVQRTHQGTTFVQGSSNKAQHQCKQSS